MVFPLDDTIVAIASPAGGAARGILRLSGPQVVSCLQSCFRPATESDGSLDAIQLATVIAGELRLAPPFAPLPGELYLWPTRRSYTRQPSAEFHTLGSPPLLEAALDPLCQAGARLAEPGEFTLRAFLAGRLDLTQAEAVLGVIDAQSQRELEVALSQLAGGLAGPLGGIRNRLLDLLADLEAGLDFVEEHLEFITTAELDRLLGEAAQAIRDAADQMAARGETPDAWRVALVGWPNVGKSSLLNALAKESAALVSETAGTTRDYVRRRVTWGDFTAELIDTAGVEPNADDAIASAAQSAAAEQTARAHLTLLCLDASRPPNAWERRQLTAAANGVQPTSPRRIVLTKADLPRACEIDVLHVAVSSVAQSGLDDLRDAIREALAEAYREGNVVSVTATRCRESLRLAHDALERARQIAAERLGDELVAAEVRLALDELGKVVGVICTDDVLDRIFSRFCIGK